MSNIDFQDMVNVSLEDIKRVCTRISSETAESICMEIIQAKRIACYGVGREGLMIKALCMRLMHLGLDAHVVGDMTTPPLGKGDLLIVSAGPGQFSTVLALTGVAKKAGSRVLAVTAQPKGEVPLKADTIIFLPAQTMADDKAGNSSILPMGSLYEIVQIVFFDMVSIMLREKTGQSPDTMRSRHTNLE